MGSYIIGPMITTFGLALDIIGAFLVAVEVVKVFHGPTTVDIGASGTLAGGFIPKVNPDYVKHERVKHLWMKVGLGFLLLGFVLQGVGVWWPVFFICQS